MGILRVAKLAGEDRPRGIVHDRQQREPGATPLEPVMDAAIDLQEHAFAGHALAPSPVFARTASLGALEPGVTEDPTQRGVGHLEAFPLDQQFLEVQMVGARIGRLRERDDLCAHCVIQTMWGLAAAIAMDQRGGSANAISGPQAPEVTRGAPEEGCGLGGGELSPFEGVEDHEMLVCALRQDNHALPNSQGRTFSLAN